MNDHPGDIIDWDRVTAPGGDEPDGEDRAAWQAFSRLLEADTVPFDAERNLARLRSQLSPQKSRATWRAPAMAAGLMTAAAVLVSLVRPAVNTAPETVQSVPSRKGAGPASFWSDSLESDVVAAQKGIADLGIDFERNTPFVALERDIALLEKEFNGGSL